MRLRLTEHQRPGARRDAVVLEGVAARTGGGGRCRWSRGSLSLRYRRKGQGSGDQQQHAETTRQQAIERPHVLSSAIGDSGGAGGVVGTTGAVTVVGIART